VSSVSPSPLRDFSTLFAAAAVFFFRVLAMYASLSCSGFIPRKTLRFYLRARKAFLGMMRASLSTE